MTALDTPLDSMTASMPEAAVVGSPADRDRSSLLAPLLGGLAWTAAAKWSTQILSWASTIVVIRFLAPADYGLVGMAAVFLGMATVLSEFGIGSAVVYLRRQTDQQIAQLNGLSVVFGAITFAACYALASPVAWFFRNPQLRPVIVVMSAAFLISSLQVVPYALLQRDKAFKWLAVADGWRAIAQATTTVILGAFGWRYWSLVYGGLAGTTVSAAFLSWRRPARFMRPRLDSIRSAMVFSRDVIVSRVSWYVYSNSDFAVAGRMLGQAQLGAYTVAWNLASTAIDKLTELISRVGPAIVSEAQHDPVSLRRYVRMLTEGISLVTFPVTFGLALVAGDFVAVVLGPRWTAVAAPLRWLALYGCVRSITTLFAPIMSAVDLRWASRYGLIFPVIFPAAFYLGSRWGTQGIAVLWVTLYPLLYIPIYRRLFAKINLHRREYVRAIWPALSSSLCMVVVVYGLKKCLPAEWPLSVHLSVEIVAGAAAYGATLGTVHRQRCTSLARTVRSVQPGALCR
jgi:O-antigen/teichoic acid export membrane protein